MMLLAAILGMAMAAPGVRADEPVIYKWVDANGIAHYTTDPERIPQALRNRIQSTRRSRRAARETPGTTDRTDPTDPIVAGRETVPPTPGSAGGLADPGTPPSRVEGAEDQPVATTDVGEARGRGLFVAAPDADEPPTTPTSASPLPAASEATPPPIRGSDDWAMVAAPLRFRSLSAGDPDELSEIERQQLVAQRTALDEQIASLEADIARDEEVLAELISVSGDAAPDPLYERPRFVEIARRLPQLQADLEELREQRTQLEPN